MNKYGLHGKLQAKHGEGARLEQLLLQSAQAMHEVKGCRIYLVSRNNNDQDAVWITEVWDSKEDHDNSLQLERVRSVIKQALPLIGIPPQKGQEFEVLGGCGIGG